MRFSLSENNIQKLAVTVIPAPKPDPKPSPEAPRVSPSPGEVLRKRLLPVLRRMASRITPRHLRLAAAFLCLAGGVFLLGYSLFHAEAAIPVPFWSWEPRSPRTRPTIWMAAS